MGERQNFYSVAGFYKNRGSIVAVANELATDGWNRGNGAAIAPRIAQVDLFLE